MPVKEIFHEDLNKAHISSSSKENFKWIGDWEIFLNDLKSEIVAWHPTWVHDNEVLMHGVNKDPTLLVDCLGMIHPIPLAMNFSRFMLK